MAGGSTPISRQGTPLALVRYIYQSPAALPFLGAAAGALAAAAAFDEATGARPAWEDGIATAALVLTLGRAIFVSLIDERNRVLARNIREACLRPPVSADGAVVSRPVVPDHDRHEGSNGDANADAPVVAVLGMAHLAGVRAALVMEAPP